MIQTTFMRLALPFAFVIGNCVMAADTRPNIVFLMSDDHQAMAMGCMGNSEIETPNLDSLAAAGVLFERCYATSPICMASRATVMSGMYEYKTGCNFLTGNLPEEVWRTRSYPLMLRQAGYRTAFAGKWGFGIGKRYNASGDFDKWGALQGGQGFYETVKNPNMTQYASQYPHVTRALGAFGRDFIRESASEEKPFCLSISFKAPHKPHDEIDPEDQKRYASMSFSEPPGFGVEGERRLPIQPKLGRQYFQRNEWSKENYQDHIKAYYQLISGLDSAVGMIVDTLEREGVADNTVIIYTSDNGYLCGAHGLQGKVLPYERASRIPLIIYDPRGPETAQGVRTPAVVGNIDFAPTILALAGLPVPKQMDGKSLLPALRNPNHRVREHLAMLQSWDVGDRDLPKGLAVVAEHWKYIYWCYGDENVPVSEELFDLRRDTYESANIANTPEMAAALDDMRKAYDNALDHWVANCEEGPYYQRYGKIFDRNLPWQEKEYRVIPDDPTRWKKWQKQMREAYETHTGASYPE